MNAPFWLAAVLCALPSAALAQTDQPGQVRMQIPLGGAQPPAGAGAGAARAQPGRPGGAAASAGNPATAGRPGAPAAQPTIVPSGENLPNAPVSAIFSSDTSMEGLLTEEVIRALRDPFAPPAIITKKEPPKTELEKVSLSDLRLNGVITGPRKVRAMLSTSGGAGGKTYFVAVGDKVGLRSGRITAIQPDLIKVVEYETDDRGRRIPEVFELRITGEIISLSKKDEG